MTPKAKTSRSADGKTWIMPGAKPKAAKKRTGKNVQAAKKPPAEKKVDKRVPALAIFPNCPAELVVTYKGATYKASVNPDGTIRVNGKTFNSPSRAGKEITGREVDGWTFWSYEVPGVGFKKLDTLRKHHEESK